MTDEKQINLILLEIYNHRCLTLNQIKSKILISKKLSVQTKKILTNEYLEGLMNDLICAGVIETSELTSKSYLNKETVYFLTASGVKQVRDYFSIPSNIYDENKQVVKRGYYRASELKISDRLINHQYFLNEFVLQFERLNQDIPYRYFDEKHVSQFNGIRPDGMISILDVDFFIEIDMGTESRKQLCEKWINYRDFLQSKKFEYTERRIVVLFVCEGVKNAEKRKNLVRLSVFDEILDLLNENFDVVVGDTSEILQMLTDEFLANIKNKENSLDRINKLMTDNHGFETIEGRCISTHLNGTVFNTYMRKSKDGKILLENGRPQEFVLDSYILKKMSVLKKIIHLNQSNVFFRNTFNRDLIYIVVGKSEKDIFDDISLFQLLNITNVYYTTIERLSSMPFGNSLFEIDSIGNVKSFSDSGLNKRVYEKSLNEQYDCTNKIKF